MAFNSETYRANRFRKQSAAYMAEARSIKERAARGEAYAWELPRVATLARLARLDLRLARSIEAGRDLTRRPGKGKTGKG